MKMEHKQEQTKEKKIKLWSSTSLDGVPLLESSRNGEEEEESKGGRWWKKVLDVEEAKNQVFFSLPMILTNISFYLITLVSVMFAGHYGELELAGATLANSFATVTGFDFMVTQSLVFNICSS